MTIKELKITTKVEDREVTQAYKIKELSGQDLYLFMEIADKIDIDALKINDAAGKVKFATPEEFAKANGIKGKKNIDEAYAKYLSSQTVSVAGLGIMTYIFKKGHLVKREINLLISKVWTMDIKVVESLNVKDYMNATKGALQLKSVIESIQSFFQ